VGRDHSWRGPCCNRSRGLVGPFLAWGTVRARRGRGPPSSSELSRGQWPPRCFGAATLAMRPSAYSRSVPIGIHRMRVQVAPPYPGVSVKFPSDRANGDCRVVDRSDGILYPRPLASHRACGALDRRRLRCSACASRHQTPPESGDPPGSCRICFGVVPAAERLA